MRTHSICSERRYNRGVALSFWQKLKLAWRGWSRRQDEAAAKRKADFLKKELKWGGTPPAASVVPPSVAPAAIDREGLQVAYLDDSGQIEYYLDRESGEVIDRRASDPPLESSRYLKAPRRSDSSDADDRRLFAESVEDAELSVRLRNADAHEFRKLIATNRNVERAWYQFKNDRATKAIEEWVKGL